MKVSLKLLPGMAVPWFHANSLLCASISCTVHGQSSYSVLRSLCTVHTNILQQKNVIRVVLLFCILLVFYLFGKMSAILHRNPKFALFEKFFSRLERKEFWLSRNIQIYKIAKKFQSMLVRNASFDAIDLGLICPCYSSRSMYRTRAIISRGLHIFYLIFQCNS